MPPSDSPIVVYSANFGGRDKPAPFITSSKRDVRAFLFTDEPTVPEGWAKRDPLFVASSPRRTARFHKIMSHRIFANALTVWHDASMQMDTDYFLDFLLEWREYDSWFSTYRHPVRDCVYAEYQACVRFGHPGQQDVYRQVQHYARQSYPAHNGLYETSVVVRRPHSNLAKLESRWWQEIEAWSDRDQVSLPFVLRELGISSLDTIPGVRESSPFFRFLGRASR